MCYTLLNMQPSKRIALLEIVKAIHIVQDHLIWKPDSAERHLRRRINRGHLPETTTLVDYERIIRTIIFHELAQIYIYWHSTSDQQVPYVAVVDIVHGETWLVMFGLDGTLESAYLVERPHYYLSEPEFEWVCKLGDIG